MCVCSGRSPTTCRQSNLHLPHKPPVSACGEAAWPGDSQTGLCSRFYAFASSVWLAQLCVFLCCFVLSLDCFDLLIFANQPPESSSLLGCTEALTRFLPLWLWERLDSYLRSAAVSLFPPAAPEGGRAAADAELQLPLEEVSYLGQEKLKSSFRRNNQAHLKTSQ